jgi:hypothetical protein
MAARGVAEITSNISSEDKEDDALVVSHIMNRNSYGIYRDSQWMRS